MMIQIKNKLILMFKIRFNLVLPLKSNN